MPALDFTVDPGKCVKCDACVRDCPHGIIIRRDGPPEVPEPPEDGCLECQHCLAVCPTGAVSVFGLKPGDSLTLGEGFLPTRKQLKTLVRGRRSVRQFHRREISPALIEELLADLAHAPTGCNDRDLTFSLVSGRDNVEKLLEAVVAALEARRRSGNELPEFLSSSAAAYRDGGEDNFFRGAPYLLVISPGEKATCGREDAVLALAYFELLAQSAGLGTTWCGMLALAAEAAPAVQGLLGLAPGTYFYAMMFGEPAVRYARTVQRDAAARIRQVKPA